MMKRKSAPRRLTAALAATSMLSASLIAAPAMAQRVEVGNAATVVGTVRISSEQTERRRIERRERIAWGDRIETGGGSQLQILLLDRSTFGIGSRSEVVIDSYVYDPEEGRSLFATFVKGALRFFSGFQNDGNNAEVTTPAGRIGIRGTAVDMIVGDDAEDIAEDEDFVGGVRSDDDESTLVILRGPGANTAGGLTPGLVEVEGAGVTVVLDQPGLAAYIPRAGAAPIGPFQISNEGLLKVQEEMAPEVADARGGNGFLEALIPAAAGAIALGLILSGGGDDVPGVTVDNPDNPNDPPDTAGRPNNPDGSNNPNGQNNDDDDQNGPIIF